MSFLSKLAFACAQYAYLLRRGAHTIADGFTDLETRDDDHSLVTTDGALLSLFEVRGVAEKISGPSFNAFNKKVAEVLASHLQRVGMRWSWTCQYENSPELVTKLIENLQQPSRSTAERLGLDLGDLFNEGVHALRPHVGIEQHYLAVWSERSLLPPSDRGEGAKQDPVPRVAFSPSFAHPVEGLRTAHKAIREALMSDLRNLGIHLELLEVHDALRRIRTLHDPHFTHLETPIVLPGDPVLPHQNPDWAEHTTDPSSIFGPAIAAQLFPRGFQYVGYDAVRCGQRWYAPVVMTLPPMQSRTFDDLLAALRATQLPWRICFHANPQWHKSTEMTLRSLAATFSTTKPVRDALRDMFAHVGTQTPTVGIRIAATTWVDERADLDERATRTLLRQNLSRIAQAMQSWGAAEVSDRVGDPGHYVTATLPGVTRALKAPMAACFLEHLTYMLPIARPHSPWLQGSCLLRTPDGRMFPLHPFSSEQKAWVYLAVAPMRAGKSVMLATLAKAVVVAPGLERLPRIGILDVGETSAGLISLIRESLPEAERAQVLYRRLRMHRSDATNIFDTPLGCRAPFGRHASFLENMLTLLSTSPGRQTEEGIPALVKTVIRIAFDRMEKAPRPYEARVDPFVDRAITSYGFPLDDTTTWWELVDQFFGQNDIHLATRAQRYAMPILDDLPGYALEPQVIDAHKGTASDGQGIPRFFAAKLSHALALYPILSGFTQLDLGTTRVISLGLDDLAPSSTTPEGQHRSTVAYLLAGHVFRRAFFMHPDDLVEVPQAYRAWHRVECFRNASEPKFLMIDEMHRCGSSPQFLKQIEMDIREGPKAKVAQLFASQRPDDFPPFISALASSIFILGCESTGPQSIVDLFELPPYCLGLIASLGKPNREGARMLAVLRTERQTFIQTVVNTLSATELWALSTTQEDRLLREHLYQLMPPAEARRYLSIRFPSGSAIEEIERRRNTMMSQRSIVSDEDFNRIIQGLAEEIVRMRVDHDRAEVTARLASART